MKSLKRELAEKEMIIQNLYDSQPALCRRISLDSLHSLHHGDSDTYHRHQGSLRIIIDKMEEMEHDRIAESDKLERRICQLENELDAANSNGKLLRTKLKIVEEELHNELEAEAHEFRKTIRKREEERDVARAEVTELERALSAADHENRRLTDLLKADDMDKLENDTSSTHDSSCCAELQRNVSELHEKLEGLQKEVRDTNTDNDAVLIPQNENGRKSQNSHLLGTLDTKVTQEKCGDVLVRHWLDEEKVEKIQKAARAAQAIFEKSQRESEELRKRIMDTEREKEKGKQEIIKLKERMNQLMAVHSAPSTLEMKEDKQEIIKESIPLQRVKGALEDQPENANVDRKSLESRITVLEVELIEQLDHVDALERGLSGENAEHRNSRRIFTSIDLETENVDATNKHLRKVIVDLERERDQGNEKLLEIRKLNSKLEVELDAVYADQQKYIVVDEERNLRNSVTDLQLQLRQQRADFEEEQADADNEIRKLREIVAKGKQETHVALESIRKLENQLAHAKNDQKAVQAKLKMFENQLRDAVNAEAKQSRTGSGQRAATTRCSAPTIERPFQRKSGDFSTATNAEHESKLLELHQKVADLEQALSAADYENRKSQTMIAAIDAEKGEGEANNNVLRVMLADLERQQGEYEAATQAEISGLRLELELAHASHAAEHQSVPLVSLRQSLL